VRALTRNPDSPAAKHLTELGAEVVKGDLTEPTTLDSAFEGCWGAFVVTNFYDSVGVEKRRMLMVISNLIHNFRQSNMIPPAKRNKARMRSGRP
jgi:hypothetical protein